MPTLSDEWDDSSDESYLDLPSLLDDLFEALSYPSNNEDEDD